MHLRASNFFPVPNRIRTRCGWASPQPRSEALVATIQPPIIANLRPDQGDGDHDENRSDSAGNHRDHSARRNSVAYRRTEPVRNKPGFEATEFVRGADEEAVHGGN